VLGHLPHHVAPSPPQVPGGRGARVGGRFSPAAAAGGPALRPGGLVRNTRAARRLGKAPGGEGWAHTRARAKERLSRWWRTPSRPRTGSGWRAGRGPS
jgi:hypothetical protein